ncbi:class I SAM-dependent methyltransferase [Pseudobacter ginsenosidimutans]|uniref:Methyltransferase family protein n=1 Tax=Pseudobacter ginsenosidimutans TaxID=661488 RepID=A0A4Q7MUH8_9BACT|nr:class I SAM-dependent methyltransferase [Pseudobacter ginsenosidimutans]QEC41603.1 class I SAM-dependent methyltransferase [Pseudobacter ginsenosidimutans]RZS71609.1 methyltransferase family protein [Pseudobacter ginsenosidimutans]
MTGFEDLQHTDPAGLETLEQFAQAKQFNRWLYDAIAPWCRGEVLEVGSGIGNLSAFFLDHGLTLTATDLRKEYCHLLQKQFGNHPGLQQVVNLDLVAPDFNTRYSALSNSFDTVVALNVVEHIRNDDLAIAHCHQMLKPGGNAVILVPAYQWLYNPFDKELGHFKRYSAKRLSGLLERQGFEVTNTRYFNAAGIFGWWLSGSLLRKKIIPASQLKTFNKLVPLFRLIDQITFHRLGLSVIAIGRKK